MTKKIKLIIGVLIGVPLLIFLWCQYDVNRLRGLGQEYRQGEYYAQRKLNMVKQDEGTLVTSWQLLENKNEYETISKNVNIVQEAWWYTTLGRRYLIHQNVRLRNRGIDALRVPNRDSDEYWTIDIYDLKDLTKKPDRVDLLKEVENGKDVISFVFRVVAINKNGQEVLPIALYTPKKEKYYKLLNLETKEIDTYIPKNKNIVTIPGYDFYPSDETNVLAGTNLVDKFLSQNLVIAKSGRMIYPNTEKVSSKYFKSLFPDNEGKLTEDNQVFLLEGTIPDLLMSYEHFFDNPQYLYKDLVIEAKYSIDGQKHIVQTREEFLKYYRIPKEEK